MVFFWEGDVRYLVGSGGCDERNTTEVGEVREVLKSRSWGRRMTGLNIPTRGIIPPGNLGIYSELHLVHVSSQLPKNVVWNPLVPVLGYENECIQRDTAFLSRGKEASEPGNTG